jgi:hypothetical protein
MKKAFLFTLLTFGVLFADTLSLTVGSSADDSAESASSGSQFRTSDHVMNATFTSHGAARFNNVTVPVGATITSATLSLATGAKTGDINLDVLAEDVDDSPALGTGTNELSNKTLTTATVLWTGTAASTDTYNDSPDISSVIQEIVDRAGWTSGNDITIVITSNTGNTTQLRAQDYSGSVPPQLEIVYTAASTRRIIIVN